MNGHKKQLICWIWLVLNLALIWGNSLLPGEISGAISDWVKDAVARLFPGPLNAGAPGGGLIRKAAHFLEFTSLGLALSWLWRMLAKRQWPRLGLPLLCGIAVACLDETIQRFVPGRHGCVTDVCIDTAGVIFGMALFLAGRKVYQQNKTNKTMEETK